MYKKTNRKKSAFSFFIIIVLILIFSLLTGTAQAGTETLITTNTSASSETFPAISGNWIVWTDSRNEDTFGSRDIYAYNVVTGDERRVTPPGSIADHPSISGNTIVWDDFRSEDFDIYAYNIDTGIETQVTNNPDNQDYPAIDGNLVVWQDNRIGDSDIYLFDLSVGIEQLLTLDTAGSDQTIPAISGNYVVWQDERNGDPDIYLLDLTGRIEHLLTPDTIGSSQTSPAISGNHVVWQDDRNNPNVDIYVNDTTSWNKDKVNDVPGVSEKVLPSISGSNVVWIDTGNPDIYLKNLTSGSDTRITNDLALLSTGDGGPKISGNRIVWTDMRNGNNDIYMYTIGPDQTCPVADFSMSAQSGTIPFSVSFSDKSLPATVSYRKWEFGDGNISTDQNPSFTYNIPGNYDVRLTINNEYCRDETPVSNMHKISVGSAPVASFTTNVTSGMVPLPVKFTDTSVAATAWNWSFGDGTYSTLPIVEHIFTDGGTYTVVLNSSNTYGYSHAQTTIQALTGANVNADTMIDGITISTPFGSPFLTYDITKLIGPVNSGTTLISTSPPLLDHGWQNITFISNDGIGFKLDGTLIMGNISSVILLIKEINPVGFSTSTGIMSSINYSVTLPSYPTGATLNTQVWEGDTSDDRNAFNTIASRAGYSYIWGIAYTTKITKTNFPAGGTAKLHMSVNSTWVDRLNGRAHTYVERISDDRSTGEVLQSRFLYNDSATNLDYFEIDSPHGFSTFGLSQLSGSGNPLQLITLSVVSHVSQQDNSGGSDSPGTVAGPGKAPAMVQNANPPQAQLAPPDIGKTEKIYANANGVVTQATLLQSTDQRAQLAIGTGVVAKDSTGSPLASVTLTALPPESLPPVPSSSIYTFAGMAYDLGPDDATFSPAISLSFAYPPNAQWGQEFTVKTFDPQSGTWQDLITTYDASTGKITALIDHFCCVALFAKPITSVTPVPKAITAVQMKAPLETPAPPPPGTALNFFIGMMAWVTDLVIKNVYILAIVIILGIAYFVKKRRYPGSGL
ncbi:MAG: hypothetical protein CVV30_03940 [Methanomicrobiales archaeon HGW-Methanomicrobiales-1]|jgi:beta propeller repeat protein|nr:MAG: hypothetical protein CVV30_03940 [Methanomicrobiales archaeon HGW-Methanomicrobiales-1]